MGIPDGVAGVQTTLGMMAKLVKRGKTNPAIRSKAVALVQNLRQKDRLGEIDAIFRFVRDGIRYVRDINNVETLHWPEQVMAQESGDCDDKVVLVNSLLQSIGYRTRFVAVGFSPGMFSHVLPEVQFGRYWLPLETTENVAPGWFPPNVRSCMIKAV